IPRWLLTHFQPVQAVRHDRHARGQVSIAELRFWRRSPYPAVRTAPLRRRPPALLRNALPPQLFLPFRSLFARVSDPARRPSGIARWHEPGSAPEFDLATELELARPAAPKPAHNPAAPTKTVRSPAA